MTDLKTEGEWRWANDDSKIRFSNWSPNQPDDNNNHEDCGHFWSHHHFEWNDAPCFLDKMGYICECSNVSKTISFFNLLLLFLCPATVGYPYSCLL